MQILYWGFPHSSVGKESAYNVGDLDSIPGLGRCPGEEKGHPLQYSGLENSMDCIAQGNAKLTQLSNFHFHFHLGYAAKSIQAHNSYFLLSFVHFLYLYTLA